MRSVTGGKADGAPFDGMCLVVYVVRLAGGCAV